MQSYTLTNLLVTIRNDQAKDGQESTFLHDNASSHKCDVVKSFLASEKAKVLNHPSYSPYLSPCDLFFISKA